MHQTGDSSPSLSAFGELRQDVFDRGTQVKVEALSSSLPASILLHSSTSLISDS